jgi:BCCT family betaine/carnitine transporter
VHEASSDSQELIEALEEVYETDYEIGQDNVERFGLDMHNPVFFISAGLIVLFVGLSLLFPDAAASGLGATKAWIQVAFDWVLLSAGNVFLLFCLLLILLPVGEIPNRRRGRETGFLPRFLVRDAVRCRDRHRLDVLGRGRAGRLFHRLVRHAAGYRNSSPEIRSAALGATLFHWGLHPWAIYAVVALALAFFCYNKGLPLTIRSTFYPLLGDRVWGTTGNVIDILAVLATIFGLATSLGFGAQQAAAGLGFLFDVGGGLTTQLTIIACVTGLALISVLRGIDGGVKLLSNINMSLALLLLVFVITAGSLSAFFANWGETLQGYAGYILPLSNPVGRSDDTFYHEWTIFYWAWWISWSPFVGMFIARVSRGRTVRQFLVAVLLVPTAVTSIWMAAFGGSGIDQIEQGVGQLAEAESRTMRWCCSRCWKTCRCR